MAERGPVKTIIRPSQVDNPAQHSLKTGDALVTGASINEILQLPTVDKTSIENTEQTVLGQHGNIFDDSEPQLNLAPPSDPNLQTALVDASAGLSCGHTKMLPNGDDWLTRD